jgi:hypothetical protein
MPRDRLRIRTDHDLIQHLIGNAAPRFSEFANLVMVAGPQAIASVRKIVGEDVGVWGAMPRFAADGANFVGHGDYVDCFRDWSTPLNQKWLREEGGHASLGHFAAYLPARASRRLLQELAESPPADLPEFVSQWPILAAWLDRLRWVYLPLSDEMPLAVFVARDSQGWMETLHSSCAGKSLPCTQIVAEAGHDTWHLSTEMRKRCGLNW